MGFQFSPVVQAHESSHGGNFSAFRLNRDLLTDFIEPIMGFDHFRMSGPTFAPHPHAGFSAVSYLFEDSIGFLRNRDSLGHDLEIEPGGVVWTQAGRGVIHDEFPARNGITVHGLQVFINLRGKHKQLAPHVFHAAHDDIPVVADQRGNRLRVVSGGVSDQHSPISPVEDFDFLDVSLCKPWRYSVKRGWNVLIYVVSGSVRVEGEGTQHLLRTHEAIGINSNQSTGLLHLNPEIETRVLVLSGQDPREPIAVYGPFIMNTREELDAAYDRYVAGEMGRLSSLAA